MLKMTRHKVFTGCLPLVFLICFAGCQTTDQNGTPAAAQATVKRSLPEVTQAIQLLFPQGNENKSSDLQIQANNMANISYRRQIHQNGNWFDHPKTITVIATALNSKETVVTVRAVRAVRFTPFSWDCVPMRPKPPDIRYPEIEKQTLDTILKSLN